MLSLAVVSALGLMGCDDETIEDIQNENAEMPAAAVTSRIKFDPAGKQLSTPNDLLFSETKDGTLNIPVADETDFSNPAVALSALDGWSTNQPFALDIIFADGVTLDTDSLNGAVTIYEAEMGASRTDADCAAVPQGVACKLLGELVFGVDFFVKGSGNSIAVIPLKPLKAKTTYIVALTDSIKDSNGAAIAGSATYELVRQDITESPFQDESLFGLQALINSYENIAEGGGVDKTSIIYTMAMTTQSTSDVLLVSKQLILADLATKDLEVAPYIGVQDTGMTALDALVGAGLIDPNAPTSIIFKAAKIYGGMLNNVRYYAGIPTTENPTAPINQPWQAACDSGATLAGVAASNPELIPEGPISANDGYCMAFGLRDIGVDANRFLTKFNPVPKLIEQQDIELMMTVPDEALVDGIRASLTLPAIDKPENGWPIVMLQHGFGGNKEQMLAITGLLSINGFATVSIDHPLHGSRGYGELSASINPAVYMNLASLLNGRDNLRQSTTDILTLRAGLNSINTAQGPFAEVDGSDVYFAGISLGGITGHNFVSLANTSLGGDLAIYDPAFKVNASLLSVPAGGIAHLLFESAAFGPTVKGTIAYAGSPEFKAFADGNNLSGDLAMAWNVFEANATEEQLAGINGAFAAFTFAAQSVIDSADPINFTEMLKANDANILVHTVIGNGTDNLEDQVLPTNVSTSPLSGTGPLVDLLGLEVTSDMLMNEAGVSGAVKFVNGKHSSLLDPSDSPESINEGLVTQEMQTQAVIFFSSKGTVIKVSDDTLVLK